VKLDALFFAAHPDDAELCCGGTIAKLSNNGRKTGIVDLTLGELGTRGSVKLRAKEASAAGKLLGISVRENLEFKDGNIENTYANRLKVISIIRHYKPDIVFIPYHEDRHPDHTNTNKLIKEAVFFSGLEKIQTKRNAALQKAYRPQKNIYYMQTYTFKPSFIIDITEEYPLKKKVMQCYGSQFYNPKNKGTETFISNKNFSDFTEARAIFYGFQIGVKYGEPFFTELPVNLAMSNLFTL